MSLALNIKQLNKIYDGDVQAGPNGAGKSTTIGIISSLIRKTSGEVSIMGKNIDKNAHIARQHIGVVAQEYNLPAFSTLENVLYEQAGYFGIKKSQAKPRIAYYLDKLQLSDKRKAQVRTLSGGMKRRVMIACALIHDPELLILDEPTAGVDIALRQTLYAFLHTLNQQGKTIILTTHYLEEAEKLCNHIAIINHGELVINTSKADLLSQAHKKRYLITLDTLPNTLECDAHHKILDDHQLEVCICEEHALNDVLQQLQSQHLKIQAIKPTHSELEQLFSDLTNKEATQ